MWYTSGMSNPSARAVLLSRAEYNQAIVSLRADGNLPLADYKAAVSLIGEVRDLYLGAVRTWDLSGVRVTFRSRAKADRFRTLTGLSTLPSLN